jgi:hypothetical protein
MYCYIIKEHTPSGTVQWRLLSHRGYPVDSSICLYQIDGESERDKNGKELRQRPRIAVYGTTTGEPESVREGGVIDGATVVKINADTVEFEQDGTKWPQEVDEPYLAKIKR